MDKMYKLTQHIWILPFDADTDRPNLGYIKSSAGATLFDAGCGPKNAKLLKDQLAANNLPMPEDIVISHFHWDHCFATGYIDGNLIAGQYTADKIEEMKALNATSLEDFIDEEKFMPRFCRDHLPLEYSDISQVKLRSIDTVMGQTARLDMGDVHIQLLKVTSPHCDGQVVAYVEEDRVLFVGDSYSACITGYDFVDNIEKRKLYYDAIKQFDFDYIVLSHFDIMSKTSFWKEAMAKLPE